MAKSVDCYHYTNYHKYTITFNTNTGINTGTGDKCNDHSYDKIDVDGKAVSRDESLTEILISKGVQEVNLITAIVSLGEGKNIHFMHILDCLI